jgi:hypothetical protein
MMALLLWAAAGAFAQTYTVTRTDDPNPGPCLPSDCSLRQAIMAANATTTVDDVVVLPANPAPYMVQYEEIALPIGDEVEVRGAGADKTVIKGDGKESIFFIGPFKTTLTGLTITGGRSAIQSNGELLVRGVAIEGNQWNGGTAGIITNGPLTVESSFLGFNHTEAASGGVIHTNAPLTILNSTIAHNTSKEGPGAISANFAVPVSITNSAVVSNRSEVAPMAAVGGSPLTVRNSIFADNRGAAGLFNCVSAGPLASLGGNVSDDATCGAGATDKPNVNPGLGTLELHGGSTAVYSLLAGSPAIDFASQCPPVDQRGVARPQGAACDSGPYEFVPPPAPAGDSELAMRVGKGKLRMNGKGRIRVRLTCPATEANPPCRGKLAIAPLRKYWPLESCDCLRSMMRQAAGRRFSISAGKTQAVVARLPRNLAAYIPDRWEPRKVRLAVQAEDAAGNRQLIVQRRKLAQAKRG